MNTNNSIQTNGKDAVASFFAPELSLEELAAVGGGGWNDSAAFRDGATDLAMVFVGLVGAGIGIASAPISFPLALGLAAVTGVGLGVAAADATIDMRSSRPDGGQTGNNQGA
jgi:hypothetical protein